jgi:hypothetical protein
MKYFLLIALLALLGSCARGDELASVLSQPLDTTVQHQVLTARQLAVGKVKFNGPVTFQIGGTGNVSTTTDAHKAQAPVAAAPDATAAEAKTSVGSPWYVYLGGGLLLALGGFMLRGRLKLSLPF